MASSHSTIMDVLPDRLDRIMLYRYLRDILKDKCAILVIQLFLNDYIDHNRRYLLSLSKIRRAISLKHRPGWKEFLGSYGGIGTMEFLKRFGFVKEVKRPVGGTSFTYYVLNIDFVAEVLCPMADQLKPPSERRKKDCSTTFTSPKRTAPPPSPPKEEVPEGDVECTGMASLILGIHDE